jgi:hypothetical protein
VHELVFADGPISVCDQKQERIEGLTGEWDNLAVAQEAPELDVDAELTELVGVDLRATRPTLRGGLRVSHGQRA